MKRYIISLIMTLLGFLSLQMDLITANDLYLPDPSSDSDYEVVTANAVIVSGSISSVNKLGESVSTIEDLKPLYVSKELQVMNELFRPYSSLAHKDAKDYISIKSQGLTYRFASHDKSGGIFFRNSNSGLVLNTSDKPLAIRSRGSIILQSQINANKLPQIGNLQNPNWGFIDFPSGNSAVKMDSQKVVIPELLLGSRDWRIGKPSDKYGIELNIPNSFNNGFIIENENNKVLLSVNAKKGETNIAGDLDIGGSYFVDTDKPLIPKGLIVAFMGSSLPPGDEWILCNGSRGTPDLRGLFVRGTSASSLTLRAQGSLIHRHIISIPSITYPINHTHAKTFGYLPLQEKNNGSIGLFNAATDKGNKGLTDWNYYGTTLSPTKGQSSAGTSWHALIGYHHHWIGSGDGNNLGVDINLSKHYQTKTVNLGRSESNATSANQSKNNSRDYSIPPYAELVYLMKT